MNFMAFTWLIVEHILIKNKFSYTNVNVFTEPLQYLQICFLRNNSSTRISCNFVECHVTYPCLQLITKAMFVNVLQHNYIQIKQFWPQWPKHNEVEVLLKSYENSLLWNLHLNLFNINNFTRKYVTITKTYWCKAV